VRALRVETAGLGGGDLELDAVDSAEPVRCKHDHGKSPRLGAECQQGRVRQVRLLGADGQPLEVARSHQGTGPAKQYAQPNAQLPPMAIRNKDDNTIQSLAVPGTAEHAVV
jgi:hypothetical protein